jgi:hypothetical protein
MKGFLWKLDDVWTTSYMTGNRKKDTWLNVIKIIEICHIARRRYLLGEGLREAPCKGQTEPQRDRRSPLIWKRETYGQYAVRGRRPAASIFLT